jgi:uncharacterized membrane protein
MYKHRDQEGPLSTFSTTRPGRARLRRAASALAIGALLIGVLAPPVSAAGGLEVTTPFPAVVVAPGSKVSFDLTITSTVTGDVALSLDGVPAGWTASIHGGGFVVDGAAVQAGKEATVRLDVAVPGDAAESTQTIRVDATLGSARDVLPIAIRINSTAAGDVTLQTTTPTLTGPSDATFPFSLTLQNNTAQDVTVSVTATTDAPNWDVKAQIAGQEQAAATVVQAGGSTTISVTATPAKDAPAGSYKVHVEAKAGDRTIPGDLEVQITGSFTATLTGPGGILSARGAAGSETTQQLIVTNTGTAPLTNVKLSAQPPANWNIRFDPETVASVDPAVPTTVNAIITPSGDAVAGDYVVSFTATADQTTATQSIRFTVETSPIWSLISLGIIVAILGGLLYVFRTYGRR